jgi:MOSC domain-containing protein YiiM
MPSSGILLQINISPGGMPKLPVMFARVTSAGIEGDRQKNKNIHGGPDRAICLYSEELYAQLRAEGIAVQSGELGENFTTRGIDLASLAPNARLRVGQCIIEITKVRIPCRQLNIWHPNLRELIQGRSGWMARVVRDGTVQAGDMVTQIANGK